MSVLKYVSLIMPNSRVEKLREEVNSLKEEVEMYRKESIYYRIKLEKIKLIQNGFNVNTISVDSKQLETILHDILSFHTKYEDEIKIEVGCLNDVLSFSSYGLRSSLEVNSTNDFKLYFELKHIRKIYHIICRIPRQYIKISFNNSNINIHNLNI